jgi:cell division protein FtsL
MNTITAAITAVVAFKCLTLYFQTKLNKADRSGSLLEQELRKEKKRFTRNADKDINDYIKANKI